jgi:hypothetical protein
MTQGTCKLLMLILFGTICTTGATGGSLLFGLSILGLIGCFAIIDKLPED